MSFHVPNKYRNKTHPILGSDNGIGNCGMFVIPFESNELKIIATDGQGEQPIWEHVSVSLNNRCPNWKELCLIKDLFWDDEDCVIQYHPPKSKYVNHYPNVLHLWRPVESEIPMPPLIYV